MPHIIVIRQWIRCVQCVLMLTFRDTRNVEEPLGMYSESHNDDITQVSACNVFSSLVLAHLATINLHRMQVARVSFVRWCVCCLDTSAMHRSFFTITAAANRNSSRQPIF